MNEPLLFEVPTNKTRLQIVKEKHAIHTHDSGIDGEDESPETGLTFNRWSAWCGCELDEAVERGRVYFGATETDAVLELCRLNKITVVL